MRSAKGPRFRASGAGAFRLTLEVVTKETAEQSPSALPNRMSHRRRIRGDAGRSHSSGAWADVCVHLDEYAMKAPLLALIAHQRRGHSRDGNPGF